MSPKVLKVAVAQLRFGRTVPENIALIRRFISDAARAGSNVVLFPECALTGYNVDFHRVARAEVEQALSAVGNAARAHRCHVLVGSPTFARGRRFNSLVFFDK